MMYGRLLRETSDERERFLGIPLIRRAVLEGVDRDLYLRFLEQAYHHVSHTCPLFERAVAACTPRDDILMQALAKYIDEERGHDAWILDDIAALGGDPVWVRDGSPGPACAAMCRHAYFLVDRVSPYAVLGMVHVLEGMSAALAKRAADSIAQRLALPNGTGTGLRYLTSHGDLDREHVDFFARLVNTIADEGLQEIVIASARTFYGLYGDIFRELGEGVPIHGA